MFNLKVLIDLSLQKQSIMGKKIFANIPYNPSLAQKY